jgi:nitroimidazol reductase NimA-like FMN-containing flavoprotein (pyridoxamine 5'-phosphate oxidase superfamily)
MGNWKSVIANGRFEELTGRAAIAAMDVLIKRFVAVERPDQPHPSYIFRESEAEPPRTDGREIVIFRIRIAEKTGRFERTSV